MPIFPEGHCTLLSELASDELAIVKFHNDPPALAGAPHGIPQSCNPICDSTPGVLKDFCAEPSEENWHK
ncbi:MAG: hypothetical protein E6G39_08100 [Actinobacteria bacterium]|nr:MAG: hypothetical protein E6G39_08100 [Actinomycetota bacterium]